MDAAKINRQICLCFRYIRIQGIQIPEHIFKPYRHIQLTAAAGLYTGRVTVLAVISCRQTSAGPNPVFKIQVVS